MKKKTGKTKKAAPDSDRGAEEFGAGMGVPMMARKPMAKAKSGKVKSMYGLRRG